MNNTVMQLLKVNIKAQLENKKVLPICLKSKPGLGKSSSVRTIANELKVPTVEISMPQKNLSFFSGIPQFIASEEMNKYKIDGLTQTEVTEWTAPELVVRANLEAEKHGGCVILLDDIHKVNRSTQAVLYELLLDRRMGQYRLHDNVAIVLTMNDSEAAGMQMMDTPVKDRMQLIDVELNSEYWIDNFGSKLNMYVSSFVRKNPNYISEEETEDLESSASPRSWEYLSNMLDVLDSKFISKNAIMIAKGFVSNDVAREFNKHVQYVNSINFEEKVAKQNIPNFKDMDFIDEILYSYIFNYIIKPIDAKYMLDLINTALESNDTFIGFLSAEMANKYSQNINGEEITKGQQIVLEKLMGTFDSTKYKLSKKDEKALNTSDFKDKKTFLKKISDYIL